MKTFTPRQTVSELDKYIIGQDGAKRMVAIARGIGGVGGRSPRSCAMRSLPRISL